MKEKLLVFFFYRFFIVPKFCITSWMSDISTFRNLKGQFTDICPPNTFVGLQISASEISPLSVRALRHKPDHVEAEEESETVAQQQPSTDCNPRGRTKVKAERKIHRTSSVLQHIEMFVYSVR